MKNQKVTISTSILHSPPPHLKLKYSYNKAQQRQSCKNQDKLHENYNNKDSCSHYLHHAVNE